MSKVNKKLRGSLFGYRFSSLVDDWIKEGKDKGEKRTQNQIIEGLGISRTTLQNWKRGEMPDQYNFERICAFFGMTVEEFNTLPKDLKYEHDPQFITELGKKHVLLSEEIGLDLNLVKALHDLINFGDEFPLYTPICFDRPRVDYLKDGVTVRAGRGDGFWDHKNSEKMEKDEELDLDLDFLQFDRNGKRITLHSGDLAYLREVQDQVVEFVKYLFYKRSREMKEEVGEVAERVKATVKVETSTDGGTSYSFGVINAKDILTDVDRFAKYGYKFVDEEGGQDHGND